jgi:hypothetical protein
VELIVCLGCDITDKCVMDIHSPKQDTTGCLFCSLLSVFQLQDPLLCDFQKATMQTIINSRSKTV